MCCNKNCDALVTLLHFYRTSFNFYIVDTSTMHLVFCNGRTVLSNQVKSFVPANCTVPPAHSVAIIIPFRDNKEQARSQQLFIMLHFMIPILIRQNIKFQFFLINQELFKGGHTAAVNPRVYTSSADSARLLKILIRFNR